MQTAKSGDVAHLGSVVAQYVKEQRVLHVCDHKGWQAIHYASERGDSDLLKVLLDADECLIDSKTYEKATPLIVAAGVGNLKAVEMLLPLMDDDSVQGKTIHEMNALNYAVCCDKAEAETIACRLIDRCKAASFIGNTSGFESIPFRVIKRRNAVIFGALLSAGISLDFCARPSYYDVDHPRYERKPVPFSLASYCVQAEWPEGLKMLINEHKQREQSCDLDTPLQSSLTELFLSYNEPCNFPLTSAWSMVFHNGNRECLDLMIQCGIEIATPAFYVPGLDDSPLIPALPLAASFKGDVWKKRDFIRYVLQLQTLQAYEKAIMDYVIWKAVTKKIYRCKTSHHLLIFCLKSVFAAVRSGHPIEETLDMIINYCGFKFNLQHIPREDQSLPCKWLSTCDYLLIERCFSRRAPLVVKYLLNQPINLAVTAATVTVAARIYPRHFAKNRIHLLVLKKLSQKPKEQCLLELSSLSAINYHIVYKTDKWCYTSICPKVLQFQLLCKGITAKLEGGFSLWFYPVVFFVYGSERSAWLKSNSATEYFNLDAYKNCDAPSLQQLCRRAIRSSLGPYQLLREPGPRMRGGRLKFARGSGWEESSIDKLPVPAILKDYLKYAPEWREYFHYIHLVRMRRSAEPDFEAIF